MTPAIDENRLFRKISLRILPVLMLGFFFSYLNRVNVGFAKLQMSSDLHFSDAVYGFGAGIFFLGYFLLEVPSNVILHRVGARRWIARIMVTWGLLSCATIFIRTPTQFYVMRFLLGLAEAGFIPGAIYYMSQWYPAARRGRAWGVFYIALASSGVIGGLVSGSILGFLSGVGGMRGWQWLILCEGIPTILLGIYIYFRMSEDIRRVTWLTDGEKTHLSTVLAAENRDKIAHGFMSLLGHGRIWALVLIYFVYNMGLYAISFWMPTLVQKMGVADPFTIGLLTALPGVCAIISMLAFGFSADRRKERKWHLIAAFSMAALGFALCVVWQNQPVLGVIALCIANMGVLSIPALFWSLPTAFLTGVTAAAGIAMINSIGNLAGFVSPYMIGYLKDVTGRTDVALIVVAAGLLVGAVAVGCVLRGRSGVGAAGVGVRS
ncbi:MULTISPECIES: MFS transporter [unclassified Caballeronia]|uniref:MFS transporter n=1 Tax=unclassified Caballeronia TaxID=2646786 RepID=UPI001FD3C9D7|nr:MULTISPECIES: MFS transporter [unclassified Caballeronia]MDR5773969.1 MFS transporter [Caballeronia sp. LZ002]MDR5849404.1 MFS transporter [Caballeronia sp. LZ003]